MMRFENQMVLQLLLEYLQFRFVFFFQMIQF